jgi:hypothetical protein
LQYVPASGTYPETPSVIANVIPVGGGGGGGAPTTSNVLIDGGSFTLSENVLIDAGSFV